MKKKSAKSICFPKIEIFFGSASSLQSLHYAVCMQSFIKIDTYSQSILCILTSYCHPKFTTFFPGQKAVLSWGKRLHSKQKIAVTKNFSAGIKESSRANFRKQGMLPTETSSPSSVLLQPRPAISSTYLFAYYLSLGRC